MNGQRGARGVLFDFDGTLTFPGALDFPAIKRDLGCPVDRPILEFLETVPGEMRRDLIHRLEEKEDRAAKASRPNKGAEPCIRALKERGILIGVLTRNSLRSVEVSLENFQEITLADFDVVMTREESVPKPSPEGVLEAAKRMGIRPDEMVVVGDFRFDVIAGKAAGAPTVLLTNGGPSSMKPGDPEPDHTISHLKELLHIISGTERSGGRGGGPPPGGRGTRVLNSGER